MVITVTFRDESIIIMTSEEAANVARLGSDINSLAHQIKTNFCLPDESSFFS